MKPSQKGSSEIGAAEPTTSHSCFHFRRSNSKPDVVGVDRPQKQLWSNMTKISFPQDAVQICHRRRLPLHIEIENMEIPRFHSSTGTRPRKTVIHHDEALLPSTQELRAFSNALNARPVIQNISRAMTMSPREIAMRGKYLIQESLLDGTGSFGKVCNFTIVSRII